MAGMDSFHESGENISARTDDSWENSQDSEYGLHASCSLSRPLFGDVGDTARGCISAMTNEMSPFRSSFSSTAAAGEYACDGGVDTREWCITIDSAAFCTASVTSLDVVHQQRSTERAKDDARYVFERQAKDGWLRIEYTQHQRLVFGKRVDFQVCHQIMTFEL
jgi:hypothetical protein